MDSQAATDSQAVMAGSGSVDLRASPPAVNKHAAPPLSPAVNKQTPQLASSPPSANTTTASSSQDQAATTSSPGEIASNYHPKQIVEAKRIKMADKSNLAGVVVGMLLMLPAILAGLLMSKTPWYLILGPVCIPILMVAYYYMPKIRTKAKTPRPAEDKGNPDISSLPAAYFCYVLGSGGHTTEMMELVRKSLRPSKNIHRRYIFTTGDRNSLVAMTDFERRITEVFGPNAGTWDAYQVTRARKVHQPLWTTWLTAILSALSVYEALTTPPDAEIRPDPKDRKLFKYPHVITTNGPGTGFLVALVAHLLKILWVRNRMKIVFFETWAHVRTLSLTGKLFHWTRLPDVYLVQHQPLSERYGYQLYEFVTLPRPVPRPVPNSDRPSSPPSPAPASPSAFLLGPASPTPVSSAVLPPEFSSHRDSPPPSPPAPTLSQTSTPTARASQSPSQD